MAKIFIIHKSLIKIHVNVLSSIFIGIYLHSFFHNTNMTSLIIQFSCETLIHEHNVANNHSSITNVQLVLFLKR